jgi:hypothetical protein
MTDPRTATQELQLQVLDSIRKGQGAVVDALKTWAEVVQSVTPPLPVPAVPFADKLPKPSEMVADAYDFAGQLLATQRKFTEDVLQLSASVLDSGTPAPAAKKTTVAAK